MPKGNGTGPMRMGPMTGRGMGYCVELAMPGFANAGGTCGQGMGRARGRGLGMGKAWRHGRAAMSYPSAGCSDQYAPGTAAHNEVEVLKNQAKYFGDALEGINKRIAKIEADKK